MVERRALIVILLLGLLAAACNTAVPGAPSPTATLTASPTTAVTASPSAPAPTATPTMAGTPVPTIDDGYGGGRTPPPPSGNATITVVSYGPVGDYLAGAAQMALYTFDNDDPGASSCTGNCAGTWPPLTVPMGEEPAAGPGISGTLDTILRDDGSYQVTYNGMPLYHYSDDAALYDTNGDGIGGVWHLARP